MFLLDTNVISELRKAKSGRADPYVLAWASSQTTANLYISVITIMEIETGILSLARRDKAQAEVLNLWLNTHVLPAFKGRILPVDLSVARRCATLHVPDQKADRDALIGATALTHGMQVVTRNIKDFKGMKVALVDPWKRPEQ